MGSFLLLALLTASPSSDAVKQAEALTRRAIVEYNGGEFDQALVDAKKAYGIQPAPALLYNLGQCHRALHQGGGIFAPRSPLAQGAPHTTFPARFRWATSAGMAGSTSSSSSRTTAPRTCSSRSASSTSPRPPIPALPESSNVGMARYFQGLSL